MATSNLKFLLTRLLLILTVTAACAKKKSQDAYLTVDSNIYTKSKYSFRDMPTIVDLDLYVAALKNLVEFCATNKNNIDINLAFGLFLINVNLKTMLKHRHASVPLLQLQRLRDLVVENNELLRFFDKMVKNDFDEKDKLHKDSYKLFSNDSSWVTRIKRNHMTFRAHRRNVNLNNLLSTYGSWENYTKRVYNWEGHNSVSKTKLSDFCLASISKNVKVTSSKICSIPNKCQEMLTNSSDVGYVLTHRLLLLLLARLGMGCSIFSPERDEEIASDLCSSMYSEAEYIAFNYYRSIDLLMEQVALCSLNGNVEFLRRSWLNEAMKHQMPPGCFGRTKAKRNFTIKEKPNWMMARASDEDITDDACNGHITGTIAAALSGAVRFIITSTKFPEFTSLQ